MVAAPHPQQQQYFLSGGSFGQPAYTYVTSGGALLAQPIGMGYGLMGNTIVPQAQYIALNSSPQVQYIMGGNQQYIAFGGENQVVMVPSSEPAKSAGNSSVRADVPIEAAPSSSRSLTSSPTTVHESTHTALREATPTPLNGDHHSSLSLGGGAQQLQQLATGDTSVQSGKYPESEGNWTLDHVTAAPPAVATPPGVSIMPSHMAASPYYSIVLQVGSEGQCISVPADPRVLSGQCSYVMVQQPDGSQQLALLENYPAPTGVDPQSSVIVQPPPPSAPSSSPSPNEDEEEVGMECPGALLAGNEAEGDPYCVEIVLLYAEQVQETTAPAPRRVVEERGQGKSLLQLLDSADKDHTHGWWYISEPLLLERLLRGLCLRGYREKGLHKVLHKTKDQVLTSLHPSLIKRWEQLASGSDGGGDGDDHTQGDLKDTEDGSHGNDREQSVEGSESQPMDQGEKDEGGSDSDCAGVTDGGQVATPSCSNGDDRPGKAEGVATSDSASMQLGSSHVVGAAGNEEVGPSYVRGERAGLPQSGDSSGPGEILGQCGVLDSPAPEMNVKVIDQVRERIEGMEQRLAIAKLQAKDHLKQASGDLDESSKVGEQCSLNELKVRLLRLEQQVDRKFLKPPLGDDIEEDSSHSKKVAMDTPPTKTMVTWRDAVRCSSSASQIAVCVNVLDQSISWEKSTSKVFCQVCRRGDSESLLLLCDGCDKGTHTYCCVPPLDSIPDGDWYCHHCAQSTHRRSCIACDVQIGTLLLCANCPKAYHKRCVHPPLQKSLCGPWYCPQCQKAKPKKKTKALDASEARQKLLMDEMARCHVLLDALEENEDSWPFLEPVEKKAFPEYFKVIKKPMDLQTVRNKLEEKKYSNKDGFAADIRLIFDNCKLYNEDDSEIGIAGQAMKTIFEKRWSEVMNKQ